MEQSGLISSLRITLAVHGLQQKVKYIFKVKLNNLAGHMLAHIVDDGLQMLSWLQKERLNS